MVPYRAVRRDRPGQSRPAGDSGRQPRLLNLAGLCRRLALGKRIDMFHAVGHFTPDGILPVQESRVTKADEELAVGRVRVRRTRHGANAPDVRLEIGRANVGTPVT